VPTLAAAGQQLQGSLSMDSMLDTAQCLETTATVLQMTTKLDNGRMICPRPYIENYNVINFKNSGNSRILTHYKMPKFNEKYIKFVAAQK